MGLLLPNAPIFLSDYGAPLPPLGMGGPGMVEETENVWVGYLVKGLYHRREGGLFPAGSGRPSNIFKQGEM